MVKYDKYDVVFQEIPNEVSLAFTLTDCPNTCSGCHSSHLREDTGTLLDRETLFNIMLKYEGQITTVLFLGGDRSPIDLIALLEVCKILKLKTAWYSGSDSIKLSMLRFLDYYKVGSYKEELGGLDSESTNQHLYRISRVGMFDITNLFWK